ncbi:MAG TPA: hypothetical protein VJ302_04955 [Blastocatellia bacterium]|nr:hypothetical protein [Blastocatellia bacterium]
MDDKPNNSSTGSGRKPTWNHMPTTVIRVPVVFSERLIELARSWDASGNFVQKDLALSQDEHRPDLKNSMAVNSDEIPEAK